MQEVVDGGDVGAEVVAVLDQGAHDLQVVLSWRVHDQLAAGERARRPVDEGGLFLDTPGMRELRLWAYVFEPLVGWILVALAATLGAPFWFDLLNKVMVVRSTVKPHEKSPEESSDDRQPSIAPAAVVAPTIAPAAPRETMATFDEPAPDPDADVDACDVEADAATHLTDDEELPATRGGVA